MLETWFLDVAGTDPLLQAFVGGLVVAGLNLVGALAVVVWRDPSQRSLDGALGFAAGVMLAASFTSLILPGIEFGGQNGLLEVIAGIVLGVVLLDRADRWVPHVHVLITGRERADQTVSQADLAPLLLFIVAITIHNMPEGLAVGVGFGSGNVSEGLSLMLAIGLQNIPEGLAVSVAAVNAGFDRTTYAALAGARAGLVEIPMVVLGALAVSVSSAILPYAMGFAAGGMLFVISDEIVPETHSNGNERAATLGLMAGVIVMLYLDVTLA
ncbi:ZIP family metal transporter [Halobacterium jilantaiense]|uniref:Zinc transporter, ZIP family n=1 Tax=Halobacterium jilantaiense TaxID=355548 RepID=A0A1I0QRL7_9EURY|nr:ZIP family metal transporter [Halobacterium jilantaiense]SEW29982.1 zinc transporter, ZIP family [Halobacterium jilantaiense]